MSRLERALRRHPRPSGRAKLELVRTAQPGLTFAVEAFPKITRELPPLFERHWQELGSSKDSIPLEPDWDRYFALAAISTLQVMTARSGETLVGYIFNLVGPHLHYRSTLHAEIEAFWLDVGYRGGSFALRWFKANDDYLKELGVKRISAGVKLGYKDGRVGLIFKRLGYAPTETVWSKVF